MNKVNIVIHHGTVSLLKEPIIEGGKLFSFAFNVALPEEKRWAFRLLALEPDGFNNDALTKALKAHPQQPRATWEEQVGHPIGYITIYFRDDDGETYGHVGTFDRGPDLSPKRGGQERDIEDPEQGGGPELSF